MKWAVAGTICVLAAACVIGAVAAGQGEPQPAGEQSDPRSAGTSPGEAEAPPQPERPFVTESLQGRVVWLADALEELHDVRVAPDARDRVLALQTREGELIPLIEDRRGQAFRVDDRLRGRDVELFVRRYRGAPLAQIIRVYSLQSDGKYELDYWCEICAISMVQLGVCDCCQAPNELRERKVQ